ncbi:ankyrin repeat domain-containing protein [Paenibacillus piri]|uniref:Ankyrin repeat domain-containing protein n=1 Tax=Paenibacillus piri TaxID=2547395 RepID=A0A4R5KNV1_9BACL|nr:ankyrin repeat domain-containing protein [Paenibacillus piri]TDF96625.1 ankyrin repeat domain-containing protein [Paenibacillus piri]
MARTKKTTPAKQHVISVRVDDLTLQAMDLLVEAGLAQSRSEAATQFVRCGVASSESLLLRAKGLAEHVRSLRRDMLEAVKERDIARVQELLEADAGLANARNERGETAVLLSAYYRAAEIKQLLIERGAELTLYEAAAIGDLELVKAQLAAAPRLLDSHSPDGFTPLALASHFGHAEVVSFLLERGAQPGLLGRDGRLNNTALQAACAGQHAAIVQLLLARGADVRQPAEGSIRAGFTPLHVAAGRGNIAIAELLLVHGAPLDARKADGQTPLAYARQQGKTAMAAWLRERGAGE